MAINVYRKSPVEVRRNGGSAFLVHFFGHKKTYKVEIQLLVGYLERRERDSGPILALFLPFLHLIHTANNAIHNGIL